MIKNVEINILDEKELYKKYNGKEVSDELIEYLIKVVQLNKRYDIKICINNNTKIKSIDLIKEGLLKEYNNSFNKHVYRSFIQIVYFLMGIIILTISSLFNGIIGEILLISGWVFIWRIVESEISIDIKERIKRRLIRKILNSEFEEKII